MLELIKTGVEKSPRLTFLYGAEGLGKSTFASKMESPIFIQTEDGLRDIDCSKFPLCKTLDDFNKQCRALFEEEHDFKTLVIDSADWLESLIQLAVTKEAGKESIEEIGYGKGYVMMSEKTVKILQGLARLRDAKGMNILITSHAVAETYHNPEGEDYDRFAPKLHKRTCPFYIEWADEVLFLTKKVFVKSEEGKAVGEGERILKTCSSPTCRAKNRLGMPPEIPLNIEEYNKYILK